MNMKRGLLVLAMYKLDNTMSQTSGALNFIRKYTLASGGLYCDCGYQKLKIKINRKVEIETS